MHAVELRGRMDLLYIRSDQHFFTAMNDDALVSGNAWVVCTHLGAFISNDKSNQFQPLTVTMASLNWSVGYNGWCRHINGVAISGRKKAGGQLVPATWLALGALDAQARVSPSALDSNGGCTCPVYLPQVPGDNATVGGWLLVYSCSTFQLGSTGGQYFANA